MLGAIFERFVQESPVSVMVRGLMEKIFAPEQIDRLFEANAEVQYTRELLFSSLVNLMSMVVCGIYPSVNAAYRAKAKQLNVTRTAVYDKLKGVEPSVSRAVVRETAAQMQQLIEQMGGKQPEQLPGYELRIIDGNCLAGTDHRLEVLRPLAAVPLPGKSLVVLDPQLKLAIDVFPCEDGHAQERSLFAQVLETVKPGQLWIADRNMCTKGFLFGIQQRQAELIIREHQALPWEAVSELQALGKTKTAQLFEQTVRISYQGDSLLLRRIVLHLFKPTRNGESEIAILTSVPATVASGAMVAKL